MPLQVQLCAMIRFTNETSTSYMQSLSFFMQKCICSKGSAPDMLGELNSAPQMY